MKIDESRIIERMMRMGIEHRLGTPLEELYDLATRQIKEEADRVEISTTFDSIQHWWNEMQKNFGVAYALIRDGNNHLRCVRIQSTDGFKIKKWASETIPYVVKQSM
jgi:hypothetical protein